jgi:hypothetical protein
VVQETLGHSSIMLTSDIYTSVYPAVAVAVADAAATLGLRAAWTDAVTFASAPSSNSQNLVGMFVLCHDSLHALTGRAVRRTRS